MSLPRLSIQRDKATLYLLDLTSKRGASKAKFFLSRGFEVRIRSPRFLVAFARHTFRSLRQVKAAPGFRGGSLLADRSWTFWTMTAWDSRDAMRAYMTTGSHRTAMPLLLDWCDEASVVHWDQDGDALPDWTEADRRMRVEGRPSKVRRPGPHHTDMSFRPPRTLTAGPIKPARA